MHYNEIKQGYFIARPNRFIAHIELDGQVEVCHVKNTGRCRELLTPRAVVYVECHHDPRRKTKYSLIAVRKGSLLINMDCRHRIRWWPNGWHQANCCRVLRC